MQTVSYTYISGDIFHYGHLRLLEEAKKVADYHICGLLSDKLCLDWNGNLVMKYEERVAILKALSCVDEIIEQPIIDPTRNLKEIHKRFSGAKIILFQGHQDWKGMPGSIFVKSIGGDVIKPEYYPRLTRSFIQNELNKSNKSTKFDIESYILGDISFFSLHDSTKANTLASLKPKLKKSFIEKIYVFTKSQWDQSSSRVLKQIRDNFKNKIVVRSSSLLEDSQYSSYAGFFHSELDVDPQDKEHVFDAVSKVISSYSKHEGNSHKDQVLVQSQTSDVAISGVVFTRDIQNRAPYYLINYNISSKTDSVTSGLACNKIEILRNVKTNELSSPWRTLLESVKEIEGLLHNLALDIEFAIKESGEVIIFQIRPLAANQKYVDTPDNKIFDSVENIIRQYVSCSKNGILDSSYSLSDMSFWNPAEIIGDRPDNLSYSIYQHLILNNAWNKGLVPLGYRKIDRPLMVRLGNKPYIEVETSFAALLPSGLEDALAEKLIRFYREKLQNNPELHDKVEFDIVHSCFSPGSNEKLIELRKVLSPSEFAKFRNSLIHLTQNIFDNYEGIVEKDLISLKTLTERRKQKTQEQGSLTLKEKISLVLELLQDAIELGTPQFARIARMAFIGHQYLKEFVSRGVITDNDADLLVSTIRTVASKLNDDYSRVVENQLSIDEFLSSYGHLRPGTYDITKLPYIKNPDYFKINHTKIKSAIYSPVISSVDFSEISNRIDLFTGNFEVSISSEQLLKFIRETTKYRESFKFEFTMNLSSALEILVEVGEQLGFDRKGLSCLSVESLKGISSSSIEDIINLWKTQTEGRKIIEEIFSYLEMPPLVFDQHDFKVLNSNYVSPNFISNKIITGEIVDIESLGADDYDMVSERIVLLENADPGYDWIFSKNIAGLITRYGGAASHMAIRCAEFNIPAAIGCGETKYKEILNRNIVHMDCAKKVLTTIRQ
jgi:glutamine kinase